MFIIPTSAFTKYQMTKIIFALLLGEFNDFFLENQNSNDVYFYEYSKFFLFGVCAFFLQVIFIKYRLC